MYQRILVPLDGSKRAEAILPQVESLARQCGARIILLEVLEPLTHYAATVVPELISAGATQRTAGVKQYVHELQANLQARGLTVDAIVKRGPIVETILDVARDEAVDLIALASHGYSGLTRLLHGSVAAEILHRARTPLLIQHVEDDA
ncbi:MAG TPA: universal stress protein [Chloroflexi bacterium]|nr:universal stress protein [Chloroflexota bacterium]